MNLLNAKGGLENQQGVTTFDEDYQYKNLKASYFALDARLNFDYVPNLKVSYFTLKDNSNSDLNTTFNEESFIGITSSNLEFNVLTLKLYQDIKAKGDYFFFFGPVYSGDIEFDIGVCMKKLDWKFTLQRTSGDDAWIQASELIFLPYIGIKYYLFGFTAYADVTALALGDAESTAYNVGAAYEFIENLYIGGGYVYEHFNVVEKTETIDFKTSGYKVSFTYVF